MNIYRACWIQWQIILRDFMTDNFVFFNAHYHYQRKHYNIIKPSYQVTESVILALRRHTSKLLAVPPPLLLTGLGG